RYIVHQLGASAGVGDPAGAALLLPPAGEPAGEAIEVGPVELGDGALGGLQGRRLLLPGLDGGLQQRRRQGADGVVVQPPVQVPPPAAQAGQAAGRGLAGPLDQVFPLHHGRSPHLEPAPPRKVSPTPTDTDPAAEPPPAGRRRGLTRRWAARTLTG